MSKLLTRPKKRTPTKPNRELLLNVSMFLLNQEMLRKQFWNVKSASYDKVNQKVNIGINTTSGRLGTTLSKLRKTSKFLSDYLYEQGLTFRKAKINFFVDKEDMEIERIYNLLHKLNDK